MKPTENAVGFFTGGDSWERLEPEDFENGVGQGIHALARAYNLFSEHQNARRSRWPINAGLATARLPRHACVATRGSLLVSLFDQLPFLASYSRTRFDTILRFSHLRRSTDYRQAWFICALHKGLFPSQSVWAGAPWAGWKPKSNSG